jgi:hypothetical protein
VAQYIKFTVIAIKDIDSLRLDDQCVIGEVQCLLSEIVQTPEKRFQLRRHQSDQGTLIVRCNEIPGLYDEIEFLLRATNLDKKELLRKSGMLKPNILTSRSCFDNVQVGQWQMDSYAYYRILQTYTKLPVPTVQIDNTSTVRWRLLETYQIRNF